MHIEEKVSLKEHTTFHIGGDADFFVRVSSVEELHEAIQCARSKSLRVTVLGGGSNVLVSDEGYRGLVIHMGILGTVFSTPENGLVKVRVGAGVVWDDFVRETVERNLWGLENLSAIPGSVGATPIQNVGAYGVEVGMLVDEVEVLNRETGEIQIILKSDCRFGYRTSFFKEDAGKKYIITAVHFILKTEAERKLEYKDLKEYFQDSPEPSQRAIRDAVILIRSKKFPDWHTLGTAGSFFKNPVIPVATFNALKITYPELPGYSDGKGNIKVALGWILDKGLSLRGYCNGDVCTFEGQALVLVNTQNATARDVEVFAEYISQQVKKVFDISIEWEVTQLK